MELPGYDAWKTRSPDDGMDPYYDEEYEPELFPVDLDDLEFLFPKGVSNMMIADSFSDPVELSKVLKKSDNPVDQFLRSVCAVAIEADDVTRTAKGCDQFLDDANVFYDAAAIFQRVCDRLKRRAQEPF